MDVDGDVDSQLLQQFSSMATTDREVLIAEFQRLLGNQLSDAGCAFFLDMNNWHVIIYSVCCDCPQKCIVLLSMLKATFRHGRRVSQTARFT